MSTHLLTYSFLFIKLTLGFGFDFELGLGLTLGLDLELEFGLGPRYRFGSDYFTENFQLRENKTKMRNIHPHFFHLLF